MKAFLVAALEALARWPMALSGDGRESPARPDERPAGRYLLVGQAREETVEQAIARAARAEGLAPAAVQGALVLGFADADPLRDWPRWFEWRRPGFEGSLGTVHSIV